MYGVVRCVSVGRWGLQGYDGELGSVDFDVVGVGRVSVAVANDVRDIIPIITTMIGGVCSILDVS